MGMVHLKVSWTLSVVYFSILYWQTDKDPVSKVVFFQVLHSAVWPQYQSRMLQDAIFRIRVENSIYNGFVVKFSTQNSYTE